jgi:hypothetical protein
VTPAGESPSEGVAGIPKEKCMLTYDDLDHFDEPTLAGLFAQAGDEGPGNAQKRRERILACLRFCRNVAFDDLPEAGVQTARRLLKRALRNQQRSRRSQPEVIGDFLEAALRALGEPCGRHEEAAEVAALRHSVEREIESAARARLHGDTRLPLLLETLARGDFEIGTDSNLAPLDEALGRFNRLAAVDLVLVLVLDGEAAPAMARIHLPIACGLWRWTVREGCSVAFDADTPLPLPADDALVPAVLAGLSLQGGRAIAIWAEAVQARPRGRLN